MKIINQPLPKMHDLVAYLKVFRVGCFGGKKWMLHQGHLHYEDIPETTGTQLGFDINPSAHGSKKERMLF